MDYIARWNGSDWIPLPGGVGPSGGVRALAAYDDGAGQALYVSGLFATVAGQAANNVARWNGTSWEVLADSGGVGVDGPAYTMAAYDDGSGAALYVGGSFTTASGRVVNNIAKWDGVEWTPLEGPTGVGVDDQVQGMAVFDDGTGAALYVGGRFQSAGGVTVNYVAKWDGIAWTPLAAPGGVGLSGESTALAVYEDIDGRALYVGGSFATVSGRMNVQSIARWDGVGWAALSGPSGTGVTSGASPRVASIGIFDDGLAPAALVVGGGFERAGGLIANRIAQWQGCPGSCYADCDGSGELDIFDFLCFQNLFGAGAMEADCDQSGGLDIFDFLCFQNAFATGCP
ncbi:MAG: hypothetical protein ACF8R7_02010 [Phycisphaerales bacterium JB039]